MKHHHLFHGDLCEFTGAIIRHDDGSPMFEFLILEGHKAGQLGVTFNGPADLCPDCIHDAAGIFFCATHREATGEAESRNTDTAGPSIFTGATLGELVEKHAKAADRAGNPVDPAGQYNGLGQRLNPDHGSVDEGDAEDYGDQPPTPTCFWYQGGTERGSWHRIIATGAELDEAVQAVKRAGYVTKRGSVEFPPTTMPTKAELDRAVRTADPAELGTDTPADSETATQLTRKQ